MRLKIKPILKVSLCYRELAEQSSKSKNMMNIKFIAIIVYIEIAKNSRIYAYKK